MMTSIEVRWDADGVFREGRPGWYVEVRGAAGWIVDSQNPRFPFDLDAWGRPDVDQVVAAVREQFPGAEVEVSGW
jgi:hypothetical protein